MNTRQDAEEQTPDDYWTVAHGQQLNDPVTFRHYTRKTGIAEVTRDSFSLPMKQAVQRCRPQRKALAGVLLPQEHRRSENEAYGIGLVFEGQPGHQPWRGLHQDFFPTYEAACAEALKLNTEVLHLDQNEAYLIVASSRAADAKERRLREALETIANTARVDKDEEDPTELRRVLLFIQDLADKILRDGPTVPDAVSGNNVEE